MRLDEIPTYADDGEGISSCRGVATWLIGEAARESPFRVAPAAYRFLAGSFAALAFAVRFLPRL